MGTVSCNVIQRFQRIKCGTFISYLITMNRKNQQPEAALLIWKKLHLSRAKLKTINKTSALMSGFATVAMVELQLEKNTVPPGLLVAFVICTSLLVAVHMLALMISTCILPHVDAISNLNNIEMVDESPHERMHWYIETGWALSTVVGIFLFLCDLAILCWVKFYNWTSVMPAISATIVMVPVLILLAIFAMHFYHRLIVHKYGVLESGMMELEKLQQQLNSHGKPVANNV